MSVLPSDLAVYGSFCDPAYDASTTLSAAITTTTQTAITVTNAGSFPQSGEFAILIDTEIMWVTQGASTTSWTVIRAICGTTAATHLISASISMPSGGGINIFAKVSFSDIVSGHTASYVSSSTADTKVIMNLQGRDTTGVLKSETTTLNGQTVVAGSQAWDRFEFTRLSSGTTNTTNPLTSAATSMTVASATNFPATGTYSVLVGLEIINITAGAGTTTWTITRGNGGTTATAHQNGDNVYLIPAGDVAVLDTTKIITNHTMQSGSANPSGTTPAIAKLASGDGASVSIGQIIRTQGGTGPNQIRTIIATSGYGTDVVAVSRSWGTVPDATTTYDVWNGIQLDLSPNQILEVRRFLWNAAADVPGGSTRTFYQQVFTINNNTTVALTAAQAQIASNTPSLPGTAALDIALATAQNDAQSVTNRQTAFSTGYGSYVVQPSATNYGANSGNLAPGAAPNTAGAQGIILRLTVPAGTSSYKGAADLRTTGNTI